MATAVSEFVLPVGDVRFLGTNWKKDQLLQVLREFGFQFFGPVDLKGLQGARLPKGWSSEGEVWVPGNIRSRQWWILDDQSRKRIEVRKKEPWGDSDVAFFMVLEHSSPDTNDPREGW